MQPIKINYASPSLAAQLEFLIRREFYVTFYNYKKPVYYFLAWTAFFILFSVLSGDKFVVLKGVLFAVTVLGFLLLLIFVMIILTTLLKRRAWKRRTINDASKGNKYYWLAFDENQLSITTETYKSDIKWNHYKNYKEDRNSIYIIPDHLYETVACSRLELGDEEYENLKAIVTVKLTLLDEVKSLQTPVADAG